MSNDKKVTQQDVDSSIEETYKKEQELSKIREENQELSLRLNNHKLKIKEQQMAEVAHLEDMMESKDIFENNFSLESMQKDIEDRKNSVTFLNKAISEHFILAPGSLVTIPSMTNNGKSTLAAEMAETLVSEGKKVLILANEEKEQDVRARISCLRTDVSFGEYKSNKCSDADYGKVLKDSKIVADQGLLHVISTKDKFSATLVTTVKGVMRTLEKAKGKFDAVFLDYYTNVNVSEFGTVDPWHVNNQLSTELNIFKDTSPFPIIVFAQCESIRSDRKVDNKGQLDYESNHPMYRWKGGKNLLMFATDIIELVKDFDNSCSWLYAHKTRFGHGELIRLQQLAFDKKMQRFVPMTAEWDASVTASRVRRKTQDEIKEMGLDNILKGNNERI